MAEDITDLDEEIRRDLEALVGLRPAPRPVLGGPRAAQASSERAVNRAPA
jgi:hypothetical protein